MRDPSSPRHHRSIPPNRSQRARAAALAIASALTACSASSSAPNASAPEERTAATHAALDPAPSCAVDRERELLVLDLSVVEDPVRAVYPGAWSFGHLVENMLGGADRDAFVLHWLAHWDTDQVVDGFTVPAKPTMHDDIVVPWITKSHENGVSGLDMRASPFRLLAIANRLDLAQPCDTGQIVKPGEARFLFGFINVLGDPKLGSETRMGTMIMEYELAAASCEQVKKWGNAWHALGSLPLGTAAYNAALEAVTESFARPNAAPGRPNGSALLRIRTNEFMQEGPWQWRQFELSAAGQLEQAPVTDTPATLLNGSALLADYVNTNEQTILAGTNTVPTTWRGQPFLGGSADGDPVSLFFNAPGIHNNEARHLFSMNTCPGCHTTETPTAFFQVGPRNLGHRSAVSAFLTGGTSTDPVDGTTVRSFAELDRRAKNLCRVVTSACPP